MELQAFEAEPGARSGDVNYFMGGVTLVKPLVERDIQPPLEEWLWQPPPAKETESACSSLPRAVWHPRISFTGFNDAERNSLCETFSLFADDDDTGVRPASENDATVMSLTNIDALLRTITGQFIDENEAEACESALQAASSLSESDGQPVLTRLAFLQAMESLRKRREVEKGSVAATRLNEELDRMMQAARAETRARDFEKRTEENRRFEISMVLRQRRTEYYSLSGQGAELRESRIRRATATNDAVALRREIEALPALGSSSAALDPVMDQDLMRAGDGEGQVSLHQLAVSRHPRPRGDVALNSAVAANGAEIMVDDVAGLLQKIPAADRTPAKPAIAPRPWQRSIRVPSTLSMALELARARKESYAPYLPPTEFWETRSEEIGEEQDAIVHGIEDERTNIPSACSSSDSLTKPSPSMPQCMLAVFGFGSNITVETIRQCFLRVGCTVAMNGGITLHNVPPHQKQPQQEEGEDAQRRPSIEPYAIVRVAAMSEAERAKCTLHGSSELRSRVGLEVYFLRSSLLPDSSTKSGPSAIWPTALMPTARFAGGSNAGHLNNDHRNSSSAKPVRYNDLIKDQEYVASLPNGAAREALRQAALEEKAREKAELGVAAMRQRQDEQAWELVRRRGRLQALKRATARGKLKHNLGRMGLKMPKREQRGPNAKGDDASVASSSTFVTSDSSSSSSASTSSSTASSSSIPFLPDALPSESTSSVKDSPTELLLTPPTEFLCAAEANDGQRARKLSHLERRERYEKLAKEPKWTVKRTLRDLGPISCLDLEPADDLLLAGRGDESLSVWDMNSGRRVCSFCQQHGPFRGPVSFALWLDGGIEQPPTFVTGSRDGKIRTFANPARRAGDQAKRSSRANDASVCSEGPKDGRETVEDPNYEAKAGPTRNAPHAMDRMGANGWRCTQEFAASKTAITCGHLSFPMGRRRSEDCFQFLATGSVGGRSAADELSGNVPLVRVWRVGKPKSVPKTGGVPMTVVVVAAAGGHDQPCGVDFDVTGTGLNDNRTVLSEVPLAEANVHATSVTSVAWIPGQKLHHLLSGSRDGEIRQWCGDFISAAKTHSTDSSSSTFPLQCVRIFQTKNPSQITSLALLASIPGVQDASMIEFAASEISGRVCVWTACLQEHNSQPNGTMPPASADVEQELKLMMHYDESVLGAIPIIHQYEDGTSQSPVSLLVSLASPFTSSSVFHIGALQGAPIIDVGLGRKAARAWLTEHKGHIAAATGNATVDMLQRLRGAQDGNSTIESNRDAAPCPARLITGGNDWNICIWER